MRINPFRDGDAHATFDNLREVTLQEIEKLDNDYVLKASPTELEQYYIEKVSITPLTVDASGYYIEGQKGTQIDVTGDFRRGAFGIPLGFISSRRCNDRQTQTVGMCARGDLSR